MQQRLPKLKKNACVVMDNAKIHLGNMVKELIERAGAKIIYLSPYSLEFSPIENFWSKVKAIFMLNLQKIKQNRVYQDAKEEGKLELIQQGKLEQKIAMIPLLKELGLTIEQIAQKLEISENSVRKNIKL